MGEDMNFDMGLPIVDLPQTNNCIIKVIGVGGGGGNAVNHMYREGIHDVSYVVCNTDKKALDDSPVPNRLQLGPGLGAGNMPEKARKIAEESIDAINNMLNDGTRMVFITAGMGGGTGTGASPVIAKLAHEMGILTVAIVTSPLKLEGVERHEQAFRGTLAAHVDGGVPVVTMDMGMLDDKKLGEMFYFFELCCGVSAYMLGVNPFDQPGVEFYKRNMFQLLGKPGYEK